MKKRPKVLVIGLDGMTDASLLPILEAGCMPCMQRLMNEGCHGTLMSTMPPVTGPAWTTFFTGRNPGSHGILDFFKVSSDGRTRRLINSREVAGKTLWNWLDEHDRTQVVINTPLTYPPTPVKGAMITGMLTPDVDADMTHPPDLYKRLKPDLGEYIITVNWQDYSPETAVRFLEDMRYCNAQRNKYIMRLMDEEDWDFFMATYTGTDRIHHSLWHYIDPAERAKLGDAYDPAVMDGIHAYFRQLDGAIERMLEKAGPDTQVFFISDHGFGPLYNKVYINNWLDRQGILKIKRMKLKGYRIATGLVRTAQRIARKVRLAGILGRTGPKSKQLTALANFAFYHVFYNSVDWSRTKAYMASNSEQGIYINLKGREPFGIVDHADYDAVCEEVRQALAALKDQNGRSLLSHFYKRSEVYSGPYTERAPDIIFGLDGGAYLAEIHLGGREIFRDISWKTGTGNHRMEGFFLAHGPGIQPVPGFETDLRHIMPTILYCLGVPIPTDIDGKLIEEIFTEDHRGRVEPVYGGSALEGAAGGEGDEIFSDEEEAELQDRLRRLGYMD